VAVLVPGAGQLLPHDRRPAGHLAEAAEGVAAVDPVRQVAYCPYCGDPVASLLSECPKAGCLQRFLAEELREALRSEAVDDIEPCGWCGATDCDDRERHERYERGEARS
jgi:hypothetical protein